MADRIKGITIEIGGNTTKLTQALSGVNKSLNQTKAALKDVDRLLKLDPSSTDLLKQKQGYLKDAVHQTAEKLKTEKEALKQLKNSSTTGEVTEEQKALEREIAATEQELRSLKKEYKSFGSVAKQKLTEAGSAMKETGKQITEAGTNITTHLTAPLIAAGAAATAAFNEVDAADDIITKKTGATGEALKGMQDVMHKIATSIPVSFEEAANAVGEVNTRFGVTGDELDDLSTKFIKFAKLNDTDVSTSVDLVKNAMNAYGLETKDTGAFLDTLTKVSQNTGVSVDTLAQDMVKYGTQLQQMGMSASDAAFFLGDLQTSGVDAGTAMTGLKTALKNAVAEGVPMSQACSDMEAAIKGAATEQEAMNIASELFGTKAGPTMAKAIRDGTLSLSDFGTSLDDSLGTMDQTFSDTMDPIDKFTTALNSLKLVGAQIGATLFTVLEPALDTVKNVLDNLLQKWNELSPETQQMIIKAALIAAAIGPVIAAIGTVVSGIGSVIGVLGALASPVGIAIALIAGLAAAFIADSGGIEGAMERIKTFWNEKLKPAFENMKTFVVDEVIPRVKSAWTDTLQPALHTAMNAIATLWTDTLKPAFENMKSFIVDTLVPAFTQNWPKVKEAVSIAINGIKLLWTNVLKKAFDAIGKFITGTLVPWFEKNFPKLKEAVKDAFDKIKGFWEDTLKPAFDAIKTKFVDEILPKLKTAFDEFKTKASDVFNAVKGFWTDTLKPAFEAIQTVFVDTVIPKVKQAFQDFQTKASEVFNAIKGFWDNTLKPAFEGIQSVLVDTVIPKAKSAFQEFQTKAEVVFNAIKGFWTNTLKPAFDKIKEVIVETVIPAVKTALEGMSTTADTVFTAIKGFWDDVLSPVFTTIGTVVSTVKDDFGTAFDAISKKVETVFGAIKKFWDETLKPVFDAIGTTLTNVGTAWDNTFGAFSQTVSEVFGTVEEVISGAISTIEGWFANITLALPDIKLPHFSVEWTDIAGIVSIPYISVSWYRKAMDQAMLLTNPTIFGAMGGHMLGGGEAGAEMVVGKDTMMGMIRDAVGGDGTLYAQIPIYLDGREIARYTADEAVTRINSQQSSALRARGAYV